MDIAGRYRNEFEDNLRRIMEHWQGITGKKPLLVLLIDDLDRCAPREVARTLETIKLFFGVPQCVFVLGFDPDWVARAIQREYGEYQDIMSDGTNYLKKLIQLNLSLPQPTRDEFVKYLDETIETAGLVDFFEDTSHAKDADPSRHVEYVPGYLTSSWRALDGIPARSSAF